MGHDITVCKKSAYRNTTQSARNSEGCPTVSAIPGIRQATAHPIEIEAEPIRRVNNYVEENQGSKILQDATVVVENPKGATH